MYTVLFITYDCVSAQCSIKASYLDMFSSNCYFLFRFQKKKYYDGNMNMNRTGGNLQQNSQKWNRTYQNLRPDVGSFWNNALWAWQHKFQISSKKRFQSNCQRALEPRAKRCWFYRWNDKYHVTICGSILLFSFLNNLLCLYQLCLFLWIRNSSIKIICLPYEILFISSS